MGVEMTRTIRKTEYRNYIIEKDGPHYNFKHKNYNPQKGRWDFGHWGFGNNYTRDDRYGFAKTLKKAKQYIDEIECYLNMDNFLEMYV